MSDLLLLNIRHVFLFKAMCFCSMGFLHVKTKSNSALWNCLRNLIRNPGVPHRREKGSFSSGCCVAWLFLVLEGREQLHWKQRQSWGYALSFQIPCRPGVLGALFLSSGSLVWASYGQDFKVTAKVAFVTEVCAEDDSSVKWWGLLETCLLYTYMLKALSQ